MCRFKAIYGLCVRSVKKISIHLMCRFKENEGIIRGSLTTFQYILCVGSSYLRSHIQQRILDFNTSYVSVQGDKILSTMCAFKNFNTSYVSVQVNILTISPLPLCISIHLMCRFKLRQAYLDAREAGFQYILCVGSRVYRILYNLCFRLFQYILCVGSSLKN